MKKNALLIVLAFALGGIAVWYFTGREQSTSAAGSGFGAQAGGGRPGGFGGGFGQSQPPLVTVARVKRDQLYDAVEALGTAQANESVMITAKAPIPCAA